MSDVVLQLKNVSKSFDGVTVLRDVDFTLRKGEIHSLVGQNGSGKSTLIKILSGVYRPDAGEAVINGEAASFPIRDARKRGLALIHQDLALVDGMSVAENVGVGVNFGADRGRPINRSRERATCKALLDEFEVSVSPDTLVAQLSPSERSVVAILRAIRELRENQESRDGIIILDEPTAALPSADAIRLTGFLRRITAQGTTALFVSHRLAEVLEISDRISVLRSGVLTGTHDSGELDQEGIITEMLGYRLGEFFPPRPKS